MPAKITETKPTHEQAQLQLRLYEQRRDAIDAAFDRMEAS